MYSAFPLESPEGIHVLGANHLYLELESRAAGRPDGLAVTLECY